MKLKNWLASGLLLASMVLPASAAGRDLAVLVVGRGNEPAMAAKERTVIETLTKLRVQRGWNHKLLPIYSYHFDKAAEKTYCEERLKVKQGDLIVVGLVELESGVPVGFVFRENDVTSADPVADKVMDRARAELAARGKLATTTPVPSAAPTRTLPPTASKPTPATTTAARPSANPATATHATATPATTHAATPAHAVTPAPAVSRPPAVARPPAHASATPVVVRTPAPVAVSTAPAPMKPAPVRTSTPPPSKPAAVVSKPAARPAPAVVVKPAPVSKPRPVAVTPAATRPTTTAGSAEHWAVQVGLFSTLEKAKALVEKLKEANMAAEIYKGTRDGQVVYRVVVGSFGSQSDAYAQAKSLQESGTQAFSVKLDASLGTVVK